MKDAGVGYALAGAGQGDEAMRTKYFALTGALLVLAFGMTACGKRGPLEPPPRADKAAHVERAAGESGKVIEEREQDVKGSHEPFILDVLL